MLEDKAQMAVTNTDKARVFYLQRVLNVLTVLIDY